MTDQATIERVPLERLHPAAWNPRLVRDKRFKDLCASLKADPGLLERRPILATLDGTIYAGNQRFRAAQQLGWTTVPAVLDDLSPGEAKARAIRDNVSAGEWQEDDYAALLYELGESGIDLATLGADSKDIDRLLASVGVGGMGEDVVPEPPADPITRPGDLWLLGPHRLLCGDSTRRADVERLMAGRRADAVFTDPPYGIDVVGSDGRIGLAPKFGRMTGDLAPFDPEHLLGLADEVVLWGANHYAHRLPPSACWLVWDKRDGDRHNDFADAELAWCGGKGVVRVFRHLWMGYSRASERGEDRVHPTQKPVAVMAWGLEQRTLSGALVLDPYLGSGSILVAAHQLGRVCYGIEIEPRYVDVAVQRWENLTGQTATREQAEVAA